MERVALPAGSFSGTVKVACCLSASRVTAAFCSLPAAVTVTLRKAISAAFRVMEAVGSVRSKSMDSIPENVAALRSGVRVRA